MKDLDIDKDNKISFEEFGKGWLSGRQGLSSQMRSLLAIKIKALRILDTLTGPLKEVLADASSNDG